MPFDLSNLGCHTHDLNVSVQNMPLYSLKDKYRMLSGWKAAFYKCFQQSTILLTASDSCVAGAVAAAGGKISSD